MRYSEFKPGPPLDRFVECFWTLVSDRNEAGAAPEAILPDGCLELILNNGAPFHEIKENGLPEKQPPHFLVGQMTRPVRIAPGGKVQLLGIRFHPAGTSPFFPQPLDELTNRIVELGDVHPVLKRDLLSALALATSLSAMVKTVEACLMRSLRDYSGDDRLLRLTSSAVRSSGCLKVDDLADAAGLSSRQLERRFLREVGIGPKMFCRILRFQAVFRAVARNSVSWANVAIDCGYYDQAHLIRDFQEFAQQTPAALLSTKQRLTEAFTRSQRPM